MLEFKSAYTAAGQWDIAVRDIKWATDWLIKAHIKASDNPKDNVFVGQVSLSCCQDIHLASFHGTAAVIQVATTGIFLRAVFVALTEHPPQ